ncbi:MAG: NnrS family protein [Acidobacteria bacterium]|nr:NnrS family protein [Acidobacteriota bacterium]
MQQGLLKEPYRPYFLLGTSIGLSLFLVWALILAQNVWGWHLFQVHYYLNFFHLLCVLYCFFPSFIFGFLFTVLPRWTAGPPVPPIRYFPGALCLLIGFVLLVAGFLGLGSFRIGIVLLIAAYLINAVQYLAILANAKQTGNREAAFILVAIGMGLVGLVLAYRFTQTNQFWAYRVVRELGLFGMLTLVFYTVIQRMLPFFAGRVLAQFGAKKHPKALYLFSIFLAGYSLGRIWLIHWLEALCALFLAGILCVDLIRWKFWQRKPALLGVLYHGVAWIAVSFLAGAIGAILASRTFELFHFHALGLGGFLVLTIGFATRVSRGHAGKSLEADGLESFTFYAIQALAAARLIAIVLWPAHWMGTVGLSVALVAVLFIWMIKMLPNWFHSPSTPD